MSVGLFSIFEHAIDFRLNNYIAYIGEVPTVSDLTMLKYTDKKEETKKVEIIQNASHKWKDIAAIILDGANRIELLEERYHNAIDCLRQTFVEGFIDNKPKKFYQDWNGLIELLRDVKLGTLADNVLKAVLHPQPSTFAKATS